MQKRTSVLTQVDRIEGPLPIVSIRFLIQKIIEFPWKWVYLL